MKSELEKIFDEELRNLKSSSNDNQKTKGINI